MVNPNPNPNPKYIYSSIIFGVHVKSMIMIIIISKFEDAKKEGKIKRENDGPTEGPVSICTAHLRVIWANLVLPLAACGALLPRTPVRLITRHRSSVGLCPLCRFRYIYIYIYIYDRAL